MFNISLMSRLNFSNDDRKQEWKLVIQGMLISGLFIFYVVTYWSMYLWNVFAHIPPQYVELGVMTLQIACPATNPLCYITCSSQVRKRVLKMFKKGTNVQPFTSDGRKAVSQANRSGVFTGTALQRNNMTNIDQPMKLESC